MKPAGDDRLALSNQNDPNRKRAFGLLDDNLESVGSVGNFVACFFGAGIQIIVREQADDGDGETASRGDERFSDTTGDLAGCRSDVALHVTEGAHHAGNRTEQDRGEERR